MVKENIVTKMCCQLDNADTVKDYLRGGRCVRLIGIQHAEAKNLAQQKGVTTYTIDIDYWEFKFHAFWLPKWKADRSNAKKLSAGSKEKCNESFSNWYTVEIIQCDKKESYSYMYKTFSIDEPVYFKIKKLITIRNKKELSKLTEYSSLNKSFFGLQDKKYHDSRRFLQDYNLYAFHVGQGMCSIIHNHERGILLDVGAGRPITRYVYLNNKIRNDLKTTINKLKLLDLVISHADSDHWRMLAWDEMLRDKISHIFIPKNMCSIAFKDKAILPKIIPSNNKIFKLADKTSLIILRSIPFRSNRNSECLVSIFRKKNSLALIPGDYVYKHFTEDENLKIKSIHIYKYDAVIVPHHGDESSSVHLVSAQSNKSHAFFSAGDHKRYKHPTNSSIQAHKDKKFFIVVNNTLKYIEKIKLL